MKNKIILGFTTLMFLLMVISCGGKKDEETVDLTPQEGMRYLDISGTGMNLYFSCPDSTVGPLDTIYQSWGAFEIKVGKEFQVSIAEGEGDIKTAKSDIANNDVNVFKRYLVDDATTLVWESTLAEKSEFHFYTIQKVGGRTYVVEDIKGEAFPQPMTEKMLNAAKSMKEKVVAPKEKA